MTNPQKKKLYKEAIKKYGIVSQLNKCMEECNELIVAISEYKKYFPPSKATPPKVFFDNVCEEIADVQNMINQLREIFDSKMIDVFIEEKLCRLKERMKEV